MKRGVLMGRFSPPHKGHEAIIDEIFSLGLRPLILVGGSGKSDDRHPYTDHQRHSMLRRIYGYDIDIIHIEDKDDWDLWFDSVQEHLLPEDTIFVNNKEQDRIDFKIHGRTYKDAFYTDIWADKGYKTHKVTFPQELGVDFINATDIRENLSNTKHLLNYKILQYIERLGA